MIGFFIEMMCFHLAVKETEELQAEEHTPTKVENIKHQIG